MELNLHPIATKSFLSGREFQEHERVVSYLARPAISESAPQVSGKKGDEAAPAFARYDLLESEDSPAFAKGDFRDPTRRQDSPELVERALA